MEIIRINMLIYIMSLLFFSFGAYAFTIKMDFEGGSSGQIVKSSSCMLGSGHVFNTSSNTTVFSDKEAYEGNQSAELNIGKGKYGFGDWGGVFQFKTCGFKDLKKGDEIWIRVRVKFPVGFDYNASPYLKFIRLRTHSNSSCLTKCNRGYDDIYIVPNPPKVPLRDISPYQHIKERGKADDGTSLDDTYTAKWRRFGKHGKDTITLGQWETYEVYYKLDDLPVDFGGEAIVRFWKDGVLLGQSTDTATLSEPQNVVVHFNLFTYWNGGSPATQKAYVDDIIITTSPNTPQDTDGSGNPYIGMGNPNIPNPPEVIIVK